MSTPLQSFLNVAFNEDFEDQEGSGPSTDLEPPVLSVQALSQQLKQKIEGTFSNIRVRGEISGFKRHTSGHLYFSLKDSDGEAVLNAICWRGTHTQVPLEEGLDIIVQGRITTYPNRSNYQVIVLDAQAAGEGTLLKLLMERKKKFAEEGLFNRHRPLPAYPKTIGVITSPTGAVFQDILHRLSDRYPCHVLLWPVAVQGTDAAAQITHAIEQFNLLSDPYRPDVLIVARGGGSIEDLWAFNEECVVRAAYQSQIPLISAVGHETDTTLIDYASDVRAPTPTAAAELATPVIRQIISDLLHMRHRAVQALLKITERMTLKLQTQKLPSPDQWIGDRRLALDERNERLVRSIKQKLQHHTTAVEYAQKLLKPPKNIIILAETKMPAIWMHCNQLVTHRFDSLQTQLGTLSDRLAQSSYAAIMQRGFCITTDSKGKIFKKSEEISEQKPQTIQMHFSDGAIKITPQWPRT